MENLVYGINPLIVSQTVIKRGHRIGIHPYKTKLAKKKWGWMYWIPVFHSFMPKEDTLDFWFGTRVVVKGSDGSTIKSFSCKSIKVALAVKQKIDSHVNRALQELKHNNTAQSE